MAIFFNEKCVFSCRKSVFDWLQRRGRVATSFRRSASEKQERRHYFLPSKLGSRCVERALQKLTIKPSLQTFQTDSVIVYRMRVSSCKVLPIELSKAITLRFSHYCTWASHRQLTHDLRHEGLFLKLIKPLTWFLQFVV